MCGCVFSQSLSNKTPDIFDYIIGVGSGAQGWDGDGDDCSSSGIHFIFDTVNMKAVTFSGHQVGHYSHLADSSEDADGAAAGEQMQTQNGGALLHIALPYATSQLSVSGTTAHCSGRTTRGLQHLRAGGEHMQKECCGSEARGGSNCYKGRGRIRI